MSEDGKETMTFEHLHREKNATMILLRHVAYAVTVAAGMLCAVVAADRPPRQAQDRPNVIFIMTDDQRYADLSCTGNPEVKTPHIDRLADEGVRLTDFHVHPFCSPTRAALMTGLHPLRTGVTMTTSRRDILRTDVPTMADWFKASGYRTGLFGKWHIGDGCRYSPEYRGFEETLTVNGGGPGTVNDYWGNTKFNDTMLRNGKWVRYEGFTTDVLFDEAMGYIESKCEDSPFFIYLPTFAPHNPRYVPKEWTDAITGANGNLAAHAATSGIRLPVECVLSPDATSLHVFCHYRRHLDGWRGRLYYWRTLHALGYDGRRVCRLDRRLHDGRIRHGAGSDLDLEIRHEPDRRRRDVDRSGHSLYRHCRLMDALR